MPSTKEKISLKRADYPEQVGVSSKEIEERISSRSKAGDLLPRGFQKIDFLEVIVPKSEEDEVQTPPIEETEFTLE